MKIIQTLLVLIVILCCLEIRAALVIDCSDCSRAEYRETARNAVPNQPGQYSVYVADERRNQLRHYLIKVKREYPYLSKVPIPRSNDVQIQTLFDNYLQAYAAVELEKLVVVFPEGSAYDLRGGANRSFINTISHFIKYESIFYPQIKMLIDTSYALFGHTKNSYQTLSIEFADQSSADMMIILSTLDQGTRIDYAPGTAETAEANLIPDSLSQYSNYAGIYPTAKALNDFLSYTETMGVTVEYEESLALKQMVMCNYELIEVRCIVSGMSEVNFYTD